MPIAHIFKSMTSRRKINLIIRNMALSSGLPTEEVIALRKKGLTFCKKCNKWNKVTTENSCKECTIKRKRKTKIKNKMELIMPVLPPPKSKRRMTDQEIVRIISTYWLKKLNWF